MNVEAILAMFTPVIIFFIFLAGLIAFFAGYMIATIRLGRYLKKYYPEVNFQEHPKKRLEIIAKRADKTVPEAEEFKENKTKQKEKE